VLAPARPRYTAPLRGSEADHEHSSTAAPPELRRRRPGTVQGRRADRPARRRDPGMNGARRPAGEAVVLREVDARGVATVTLNRPHVNNAYDGALIEALRDALASVRADPGARVVVLRGNGRHFQAGADLGWIESLRAQGEAENLEVSRRTAAVMRELDELPLPTLALVHGGCYGGGVGLVAACDVVIAESSAQFAITEARWGLVPAVIVPQLVAAMGLRALRRYALGCERFDAQRAKETGLVHELCEPGALAAAAAPVIDALLRSGPQALAATKALLHDHAGRAPSGDAGERRVRAHTRQRASAEAAEGLASFRERRDPAWYPGGE